MIEMLKKRAIVVAALVLPAAAFGALSFNGTNQYVTFGVARSLGSPTFTLETWFNWTGGGVAATTGNGGVLAIPLVTKMSAEADGDNRDGNYFLGIRSPDGVLAADMEEGAKGVAPGTNHPVVGITTIRTNTWHHAAVTYNGTTWMLYLDGNLETALVAGQPPRSDSIQHAGLASSLNSAGVPLGFFAGMLDEVRIWNYARSSSQIASNKNVQLREAAGLLGCWSLSETNGLLAHDNSGKAPPGTLKNGPSWANDNRALEDVVTPIKLAAVDPDRTAVLREVESKRVPPIFRFDPGVADRAEKKLSAGFIITREQFMVGLAEAFPGQSGTQITARPEFANFVTQFQSSNLKGYPFSAATARKWAEGHRDSLTLSNLTLKLRDATSRYITLDLLPAELREGLWQVRLLTVSSNKELPSVEMVESQAIVWPRTNFYQVTHARTLLRQRFSTNDQAVATYLAGFVKENCAFEPELTRRSRQHRVESIAAIDHYEPGDLIVRKGQIIDARIKVALAELSKQSDAEETRARLVAEQAKAQSDLRDLEQKSAISEFKSEHFGQQNRWLLGGLIAVAITSSIAVWQVARSRRSHTRLPATLDGGQLEIQPEYGLRPETMSEADWQERALHAEKRVAQATAVVRAGLLPHLALWFKSKLFRGLISERSYLIKIQQMAEAELAELDKRLAELQAPLQERLRCYERRIVELENELAIKGQQNQELIRAKIESTRKKIETAQRARM